MLKIDSRITFCQTVSIEINKATWQLYLAFEIPAAGLICFTLGKMMVVFLLLLFFGLFLLNTWWHRLTGTKRRERNGFDMQQRSLAGLEPGYIVSI